MRGGPPPVGGVVVGAAGGAPTGTPRTVGRLERRGRERRSAVAERWRGAYFIATPEAHTVDGYKEKLVCESH